MVNSSLVNISNFSLFNRLTLNCINFSKGISSLSRPIKRTSILNPNTPNNLQFPNYTSKPSISRNTKNPKPDIIDISSDSSTELSGWSNYMPPNASTSSKKKSKKRVEKPISSSSSDEDLSNLPRYVYDSEVDDDTSRLEKVFEQELKKVASSFRRISVPENTQPSQPRPKLPK